MNTIIDLGTIAPGLYVVTVVSGQQTFTRRLVVD
ncbi:MAG: T9SS type A sorting domain-containing protein [Flavobacteriales bacterium]|nr:T9SS type A sorting domain-containing protein [Flavobacteriales bacterium]